MSFKKLFLCFQFFFLSVFLTPCTQAPVCGVCEKDADCLEGQICHKPVATAFGKCHSPSQAPTCFPALEPSNEGPGKDGLPDGSPEPRPEATQDGAESLVERKPEPSEPSPDRSEPTPEPLPEKSHEPTPEVAADANPEPKPETTVERGPEPTAEFGPEPKPEPTTEFGPEPKPEPRPESPKEATPETSPESLPEPSPCFPEGGTRACYTGATGCTKSGASYTCVGLCKSGTQRCQAGFWAACLEERPPSKEVCNRQDDDCDGSVDEGCSFCLPSVPTVTGFQGHTSFVQDLAFSPDGKSLASSSSNELTRWDFEQRRPAFVRSSLGVQFGALTFSPDGQTLFVAEYNGNNNIARRNASDGVLLSPLPPPLAHGHSIYRLTFPPVPSTPLFFASVSEDTAVKAWEAPTLLKLKERGFGTFLFDAAFSADGKTLAVAGSDGRIFLLHADDPMAGLFLDSITILASGAPNGHTAAVNGVAYSPNGTWLASGSSDKTVKLWDVLTSAWFATLTGHLGEVQRVAFSPDSKLLASSSSDETVRLWDMTVRPVVAQTTIPLLKGRPIHRIAFSPDGKFLAMALFTTPPVQEHSIHLWDVAKKAYTGELFGHIGAIRAVAYAPDGKAAASASDDTKIKLWDPATGGLLQTLLGHTSPVRSLAFSPKGFLLASGDSVGLTKIWNLLDGKVRFNLSATAVGEIASLAFSPDGKALATTDGNEIALWNPLTGQPLRNLTGATAKIRSLAFSPDGQWLVAGDDGASVRLWNAVTGAFAGTRSGHALAIQSVAFASDSKTFASASADKTVKLWKTTQGPSLRTLQAIGGVNGHTAPIRSLAFSPDGKYIASASDDRSVIFWEPEAAIGQEFVQALPAHPDAVSSLAFSPDGRTLVTGTAGASGSATWLVRFFACPCTAGQQRACYGASKGCTFFADGTSACVGVCKTGTQVCLASGVFGPCSGEVTPTQEVVDGKDNDCDGISE